MASRQRVVGPPNLPLDSLRGVGRRTEGSQLRFVFTHDQSGDRRVEGVFGPGGPLEKASRLLRKVLEQIVVSRRPPALVDRTSQGARIDLHHARPSLGERPDAEAVLGKRRQMRHPANRASAHGAGTTDLKDRLRTHRVLASLGLPVEPCFRMGISLTGAPPEGVFASFKQILALLSHGRPHVLPAGPTVLLAPPRGERKGEVQSDDHAGLDFTKLEKLRDELTAAKSVSQLSQPAVPDLG
jgi:hypothetical protein